VTNFKKFIFYCCCTIFAVTLGGSKAMATENQNWVSVRLSAEKGESWRLHVSLTNTSGQVVEVFRSDLPWESRHSMILVLVEVHAGNITVPEIHPTDSPIVGEQTIGPGEILEGQILLEDRFPDLAKVLAHSDVIAFWSYQLKAIKGPGLPRTGGWVFIPKLK
jgi:hypothetical protein